MKRFLGKVFNIHEGEHGKVLVSLLVFLLVMSGIILGRNARDSIFLQNVDIKFLPYMYLLNAIFVVVVSIVYSAVIDKMDRFKFMIASMLLYAGIAFAMRIMIFAGAESGKTMLALFSTICYVIVQILWLIGLMQFWTFMGDVFDARESKRLFPVISSGGLLGMVVAGVGGKYLVKAIGTENLFVVWAIMLLGCVGLIIMMRIKYVKKPAEDDKKKAAPARPPEKKSQVQEFKEGFTYLKSSNLLKVMVFINLAMWIVFTIVDYEFSKEAKLRFANKDELTAFLGLFRAGAGFLCLVVQLGFTTRLVARFGVGRTINVHPAFMVAATAFVTAKFGFISAAFAKFGDHVLLYTIQDSSYQMLYNPVPPEKRGRARAFVEGYIKPISMGLAGIILIVVTMFTFPQTKVVLSAISFVAAIVWVFFSLRANKGYVGALTDSLTTSDLNLRASAMSQLHKLSGTDNMKVLGGVLKGGEPESMLFALEMIEALKADELLDDVRGMLVHPSADVRSAAISTLASFRDKSILPELEKHLKDPKAEVRRSAVKAIGRIGDDESVGLIAPLLEDKKRGVREDAVVALIRAGGLDGILQAGDLLKKMLDSSDTDDRCSAADILGSLKVKHFTANLLKLASDPEENVRNHAIKALAKIEDSRAAGALIGSLADKRAARHAEKGLIALRKKALPLLNAAALDESKDIEIRRRSVKIIGRMHEPDANRILLDLLKNNEPAVRAAALTALASAAYSAERKQELRPVIAEYIKHETDYVYSLKYSAAFLSNSQKKPPDIFTGAIEEYATQALGRIFEALSIILDRSAVRGIWAKLRSDDPKVKPLALEALDNIGEKDLTKRLTPLFEERSPEDTMAMCKAAGGAADEAGHYERFAKDKSPWMRGCTAYALGIAGGDRTAALLRPLAEDPDPFVRETAEWSLKNAGNQ